MPDTAVEAIGWASSLVLVLTIGKQVVKQWRERTTTGVTRWLFIGQSAASSGFVVYSVLRRDWVFVATNALMLASGVAGYLVLRWNRRRARRRGGSGQWKSWEMSTSADRPESGSKRSALIETTPS